MKILVTGAKGFVGKNLCQALYNVAVSELRSYLIAPDDALTLTTVPKVGIQLTVDHTKLRPHRWWHYVGMAAPTR